MKTFHSAKTGKFVSQEFAEANPDTTVELTNVNLRKELHDFFIFFRMNGAAYTGMTIEEFVDEYLKQK